MQKFVYKTSVTLIVLLLFAFTSMAQNAYTLSFHPTYNNKSLVLNDMYYKLPHTTDSLQITKLKFYISAIEFYKDDKLVFAEKNSFHLIDASVEQTQELHINKPSNILFNYISFNLGIDSNTNIKGALGGDLDPIKGMYWAWHSGYINFKLEGNSNVCNTRNNAFEFHLGGFQSPYYSMQKVRLAVASTNNASIVMDIAKYFAQINLANTNMIMTPSKEAVELSKIAASIFSIQAQ